MTKPRKLRKRRALKRAYSENQHSEDVFKPSRKDVNYWFDFINLVMFNNELTKPKITVKRIHNNFGWAEADPNTGKTHICLTNRFTEQAEYQASARQMFINTLAHEMVHLWDFQTRNRMTHGQFFKQWEKKFQRLGIVI